MTQATELTGLRQLKITTSYALSQSVGVKFRQVDDVIMYAAPTEAHVTLTYHWSRDSFSRRAAYVELLSWQYTSPARYGIPTPSNGWHLSELPTEILQALGITID